MGKRALLMILLLVFLGSFSLFLYDNLFNITGKPIFLDDSFNKAASDFGANKPTTISLSPSGCSLIDISSSLLVVKLGSNVSIYIDGNGCIGQEINVSIYEKDYIFDDPIQVLSGKFTKNRLTLNWIIDNNFAKLFDDYFEGNSVEIYFKSGDFESKPLTLSMASYEEQLYFSPSEESYTFKLIFWIVLTTLVGSMLIVLVLIIRFARFNSRFNY